MHVFHYSGPPSVPTLSCVNLSEDVIGAMNVTVSWTLSSGDTADFYLVNITTNAPQTPYDGLLNITTPSITQYELTGFMAGYEYNITVHGFNCGDQGGSESNSLTITPQGTVCAFGALCDHIIMFLVLFSTQKMQHAQKWAMFCALFYHIADCSHILM